jgi:ABC-type Mn2+/Zn2+ transport system permease subunit/Mn-dependent DtxR family transcriptional regulator
MGIDMTLLATAAGIPWQERLTMPFVYYWEPLLGSALIGAVLGVLGCFVVLRRMALIGDAISHAVLPGVVVAFLLVSTGITGLFIGALVAGILTAVGINLVSRLSRVKEDAAVGIVFTAMFALGVILISWLPAGTHFDLKCFLFGDPLAVRTTDLISIAIIVPIVIGTVFVLFRPLKLMSFDPVMASTMGFNVTVLHYVLMILLSGTVVAALRSVGVIMAVAMLITPAAVGYQLTNRLQSMIAIAAGTGAASALLGMFLAFQVDCPPGPAMVLVATLLFVAAMILAPERGVLAERRRRRRVQEHIVEEDVLKALIRQFTDGEAAAADLVRVLHNVAATAVSRAIERLAREGFLLRERGLCVLTPSGRERAVSLVRAHRIWETYLAEQNISDPELHEMAERLEHAHEVAGELSAALGHPTVDPHGEPIPQPDQASLPDAPK